MEWFLGHWRLDYTLRAFTLFGGIRSWDWLPVEMESIRDGFPHFELGRVPIDIQKRQLGRMDEWLL